MSPLRGCPLCGRPGCNRRCAPSRPRAPRRRYSDTAAYRRMVEAVLETYGPACFYGDGDEYDDTPRSDRSLVLAHVTAHADGGAFELDNLRPAHLDCNRAAGRG